MNCTFRRCIALMTGTMLVIALGTLANVNANARASIEQASTCRVSTTHGDAQGVLRGGTCTYIGIPYAAPPTGNLRWRPPQPRAPWAPTTWEANVLRQCPQLNINTAAVMGNEDCLLLNVWTPTVRRPGPGLAVLVWLHTGGFQSTTANFAASDGARFAETRGAVVVAPNYRLGPFGFLAHDALTAEDSAYPSSGNYGIADQRAALRWVRANIAAFGGDPNNVTLAGTSAGSESTNIHLISPQSQGLFHRAILQSGNASMRQDTIVDAAAQGAAFAAALECRDPSSVLTCMRAATVERVLRALPLGQSQISEGTRADWGPVVDDIELSEQPRELHRRGRVSRVPVIVGVNGDEGWTFVDRSYPSGLDLLQYERAIHGEFGMDAETVLRLYPAAAFATPKEALARVVGDAEYVCEARRIARAMHYAGGPVFFYAFEYPLEGLASGRVLHGLESNFVFGNDFAITPTLGILAPRPLTPADRVVSDIMGTFWREFMNTGNPNPPGAAQWWPAYRPGPFEDQNDPSRWDRHFVFADRIGVRQHIRDSQCNFWESFNFRSTLGTVPAAAR